MAENSAIAWTRSTFNPWIGCSRVSPGCDHCYAEALDSRKRWGGGGVTHWGPGVPRHRTSASNWRQPLQWEAKQRVLVHTWSRACEELGGEAELVARGFLKPEPWRVFCGSLCDVFYNEVPAVWRHDLWKLILDTPNLSWLLVTKRIGNVAKMWPVIAESPPPNVRLLITVVNQEEAARDIPKLLELQCKNGISYEPALGPIDWTEIRYTEEDLDLRLNVLSGEVWIENSTSPSAYDISEAYRVGWVIVGGESDQPGRKARPFDIAWARSTVEQCHSAGVACFVKQLGSTPVWHDCSTVSEFGAQDSCGGLSLKDRAGADPGEWPEHLRVREFPE